MAFSHGKNAQLYVNAYNMSSYFSDFTMAAKAGVADTTVYGRGAKTYIVGIREGTLNAKGFFDPTANSGSDAILAVALGANDQQISLSPSGLWSPGTRVISAAGIETDYSVMSPVTNVVAVSAAFNADGGLNTGVSLHDPGSAAAETTIGTIFGQTSFQAGHSAGGVADSYAALLSAGTINGGVANFHLTAFGGTVSPTITAAKVQHAASLSTTTTAGSTTTVINVTSSTGWAATGTLAFISNGTLVTASYGTITPGTTTAIPLDTALPSSQVPGTGVTVYTASTTWADLVVFTGTPFTAIGSSNGSITTGTTINPWIRSAITTTGTTISAQFLTTFVRF